MAWWQALSNLANVGLNAYGASQGGGGTAGLNSGDARYVADFEMKQALRNEQFQKDLATHGLRWRVEDATAAGLHPLAALGAQTGGGSFGGPISVMAESKGPNLGSRLANMGQDISRSVMAMATPEEKAYKQLQLQKLKTENLILETELLEKRKALNAPGTSPGIGSLETSGYTIGGQPDAMRTKVNPNQLVFSENGSPQQTAGANPIFDMYRTKRGYLPLLSQRAAESTEDDYLAKIGIHLQSLVSGRGGPAAFSKNYRVPPGYDRYAYGGPIMGYGPIKKDRMTVWEAVHTLAPEIWRNLNSRVWGARGKRFYDRDNIGK